MQVSCKYSVRKWQTKNYLPQLCHMMCTLIQKYTLHLKNFFHFWISPYQHMFLKEYNTIQHNKIQCKKQNGIEQNTEGQALCALWPWLILCTALELIHSACPHFEQSAVSCCSNVFKVTWFHKMMTQVSVSSCGQSLPVKKNVSGCFRCLLAFITLTVYQPQFKYETS